MFDIRPLLTAQFWFNTNPPPMLPFFEKAFFILYCVALATALVLGFFERKAKSPITRSLFEKLRRKDTTFGIIGLALSFFAYERTPFLSMRFFIATLFALLIGWSIIIFRWRFRTAPRLQQKVEAQKAFEKYLP